MQEAKEYYMAAAVRNSEEGPRSNKDIVQRFREEYGAALADARIAAEHTQTPGWKALYLGYFEADKAMRREQAKGLKNAAEVLEMSDLSEAGEKDVKDLIKASTERRERKAAFRLDTIEPATKAVHTCEKIREKYTYEADQLESHAPLHNVGLVEIMKAEIRGQPWPVFDQESGEVRVEKPKAV